MNPATTMTEPVLPVGIAVLLVGLGVIGGVYSLLTGFHPKWKKTLHWERFKKGPPLSRWSHATAAAFCFVGPTALCSESFGFPVWLTAFIRILAGVVSALMIGGMIYDLLASLFQRPA